MQGFTDALVQQAARRVTLFLVLTGLVAVMVFEVYKHDHPTSKLSPACCSANECAIYHHHGK